MTEPRPSYPSLRFAVSPLKSAGLVPRSSRPLDLPRGEGLDLLDWLGLGRPEFGAIAARELAPRCRRRLWNVDRNAHALLRDRTAQLLVLAEAAGEGTVLFG